MHGSIGRTFAWLGGGLFALSLVLTGWMYLTTFSHNLPGPSVAAAAIDALLLTLFALHHSLFARPAAKAAVATRVPADLVRSVYVWIASLLLIGVMIGWQPVGGVPYQTAGWARLPFFAVQLLGLALVVRAVRAIRALELAGIEPPRERSEDLQIGGPYALVRHPLYLGWILSVGAASHMTGDRLLFAAVTTLYIAIAIPWEERGLAREFGDSYARYRAQVRWRVLPYVY